jgi:hypothetical protein
MRFLQSLVIATSLFFVCSVQSSNQWYFGATQGFFSLGEADLWDGEIDIGQAGFQIGKLLRDDMSIEAGYAFNLDRKNFYTGSVSAVFWMGEDSNKYQPYVLIGANLYHFYEQGQRRRSGQFAFGAGVGTKISQKFQFRADLRSMARRSQNNDDYAMQFSINRLFD